MPYLINNTNLFNYLVYAEISWIILYVICIFKGLLIDDFFLGSLSLYILGFAGFEYAVGFLIVLFFKKVFGSLKTNSGSFFLNNYKFL